MRSVLAFGALLFISAVVSSQISKSPRLSRDPEAWWNAETVGLVSFYGAVIFGGLLIVVFDHY